MSIVDDTKTRGVYFPRPERKPEHEHARSARSLATLTPDPLSGVGKERARLKREYPSVWRDAP